MTTELEQLLLKALTEFSMHSEELVQRLAEQQTQQSLQLASLSERLQKLTELMKN